MDTEYRDFEIVKVYQDFRLIDSELSQCEYSSQDGEPLALGYYVVNWPDPNCVRQFNEKAVFHGPFKFHKGAQAAVACMRTERSRQFVELDHIPKLIRAINVFTNSFLKELNFAA